MRQAPIHASSIELAHRATPERELAEKVRDPRISHDGGTHNGRTASSRASETRAMLRKVIKYLPVILPVAMKIIQSQRAKGTATSASTTRTRR